MISLACLPGIELIGESCAALICDLFDGAEQCSELQIVLNVGFEIVIRRQRERFCKPRCC